MGRWLTSWLAAARHVSDRPLLWLPGALAWTVGVGWLPLVVAVASPPTEADLAFFGAGVFTSGAWPWNAVLMALAGVVAVVMAVALISVAEAALLDRLGGHAPRASDAAGVLGVNLAVGTPAFMLALLAGTAAVLIAPSEFRGPTTGSGPVVATLLAISPLLVALAVSLALATALAAAATRLAVASSHRPLAALRAAPRVLVRAGGAAVAQAVATWVVRLAYLVVVVALLRVLWAPIGERLAVDGARIDIGLGLLLVGFVAIWLCLVLGGGAVHAWSSATWSLLLGHGSAPDREETADRT